MATSEEARIKVWLTRAASRLGRAAIWPASRKVLSAETDYIFEFYCFVRIVRDLQTNYRIDYIPGAGLNAHCFPRKPAAKLDRPMFEIHDNATGALLWQVCLGTKVRDLHGRERAPDISLQGADAAADSPSCNDVELIWDAKFKGDRAARLTDADIATFAHVVEFFGLRGRAIPRIQFDRLEELACNGLLTNGAFSTERDAGLRRFCMREIKQFFPGEIFNPRP